MAVSKTQNERPAIDALIDLANQLEGESNTHAQNIATLTEGLADEVRDRESADTLLEGAIEGEAEARAQAVQDEATARIGADTTLTNSIGATNAQVLLLGNAQDALSMAVNGILATLENVKFGMIPLDLTVPANDTYTGSYIYAEPFDSTAKTLVMLGFADGPMPATLSLTLVDSSYSGFSYSIRNTDTDPATVTVGYLAIAAIPLS